MDIDGVDTSIHNQNDNHDINTNKNNNNNTDISTNNTLRDASNITAADNNHAKGDTHEQHYISSHSALTRWVLWVSCWTSQRFASNSDSTANSNQVHIYLLGAIPPTTARAIYDERQKAQPGPIGDSVTPYAYSQGILSEMTNNIISKNRIFRLLRHDSSATADISDLAVTTNIWVSMNAFLLRLVDYEACNLRNLPQATPEQFDTSCWTTLRLIAEDTEDRVSEHIALLATQAHFLKTTHAALTSTHPGIFSVDRGNDHERVAWSGYLRWMVPGVRRELARFRELMTSQLGDETTFHLGMRKNTWWQDTALCLLAFETHRVQTKTIPHPSTVDALKHVLTKKNKPQHAFVPTFRALRAEMTESIEDLAGLVETVLTIVGLPATKEAHPTEKIHSRDALGTTSVGNPGSLVHSILTSVRRDPRSAILGQDAGAHAPLNKAVNAGTSAADRQLYIHLHANMCLPEDVVTQLVPLVATNLTSLGYSPNTWLELRDHSLDPQYLCDRRCWRSHTTEETLEEAWKLGDDGDASTIMEPQPYDTVELQPATVSVNHSNRADLALVIGITLNATGLMQPAKQQHLANWLLLAIDQQVRQRTEDIPNAVIVDALVIVTLQETHQPRWTAATGSKTTAFSTLLAAIPSHAVVLPAPAQEQPLGRGIWNRGGLLTLVWAERRHLVDGRRWTIPFSAAEPAITEHRLDDGQSDDQEDAATAQSAHNRTITIHISSLTVSWASTCVRVINAYATPNAIAKADEETLLTQLLAHVPPTPMKMWMAGDFNVGQLCNYNNHGTAPAVRNYRRLVEAVATCRKATDVSAVPGDNREDYTYFATVTQAAQAEGSASTNDGMVTGAEENATAMPSTMHTWLPWQAHHP